MESSTRVPQLKKLLYQLLPVQLSVVVELNEVSWMDFNGQEVIARTPHSSAIDWKEVQLAYTSGKPCQVAVGDQKLSINFKLLKIGGVAVNEWGLRFKDSFVTAVNELRELTKDSVTFAELADLSDVIEMNLFQKKVGEYQLDNVRYRVTFEQDVPEHMLIGDESLSVIAAKDIVNTYLKKEHREVVEAVNSIMRSIKDKMHEIPNVRDTSFRQLIWTERLAEFDALEQHLIGKGLLSVEYALQMQKKDSALFLFLLGDHGFIRRRVGDTPRGYRNKVRKAFEEHYQLTGSLADQFKPSDYPTRGINPVLLDIPIQLLGAKTDHNPVNE